MIKRILAQNLKEKPPEDKLGFGKYFTDHMLTADYNAESGWHNFVIRPFAPVPFSPAATVFHYGQGIFEGLKAYRNVRGGVNLFRPRDNFIRLNNSAKRLCMPQLSPDTALAALTELLAVEREWIPKADGTSLYIRPFMIADSAFLGVKAAVEYKFFIILSPVGAYYERGLSPAKIYVEDIYTRAAAGGTGAAKCLGNYAASLLAGEKAKKQGFDQVLWLDADKKHVEEIGAMNIFFVIDGEVVTPELNGSILAGITRDSALKLLRDKQVKVTERAVGIDEVIKAAKGGALTEAFGTGTAAVISPVGSLMYKGENYNIADGKMGTLSALLYDTLTGIQTGRELDTFGWVTSL